MPLLTEWGIAIAIQSLTDWMSKRVIYLLHGKKQMVGNWKTEALLTKNFLAMIFGLQILIITLRFRLGVFMLCLVRDQLYLPFLTLSQMHIPEDYTDIVRPLERSLVQRNCIPEILKFFLEKLRVLEKLFRCVQNLILRLAI